VGSSSAVAADPTPAPDLAVTGAVRSDGCALVTQTHLTQDSADRAEIESLSRKLQSLQTTYALQHANSVQAHRVAESLRAFFEMLFESLPQPVLTLDRDGHVQRWNSAAQIVFRTPRDPAEVRPLTSWMSEPACGALLRASAEAFQRGEETSTLFAEAQMLEGPVDIQPGITARSMTVLPLSRIPGWVEATIVVIDIVWQEVATTALAA
jgi:PAS domain-containing protein